MFQKLSDLLREKIVPSVWESDKNFWIFVADGQEFSKIMSRAEGIENGNDAEKEKKLAAGKRAQWALPKEKIEDVYLPNLIQYG